MTRRRIRLALVAPALAGLAVFLVWGLAGLPDFGDYHGAYGNVLNHVAVGERHTTNVVASVVFDYRGVDTMGEELILFAAVLGVVLLLRTERDEDVGRPADAVTSDAVTAVGALAAPVLLVLGLWIVAFGYITPGGGFQGGVMIASAFLLVYAATSYRSFRALSEPSFVDLAEGIGAGAYVAIGLAGLVDSGAFLHNVLGHGVTGTLRSGGSIPLLNWAAAIEVAAAMLLLYTEFLEEYVEPLARRRR